MMIFLVVLFVFMVSYGVGMTSVLVPQHITSQTFKDVLLYPFLNTLGTIEFTYDPAGMLFVTQNAFER